MSSLPYHVLHCQASQALCWVNPKSPMDLSNLYSHGWCKGLVMPIGYLCSTENHPQSGWDMSWCVLFTSSRKFTEGWQHFRLIFSMLNSFLLSPVSLCCNAIIGWVSNGSTWFKIIPNQEHKVFIQQLLHMLLVQLSTVIPCFSSSEEWHMPGRRRTQMLRYKSLRRKIFIKINFIKINFTQNCCTVLKLQTCKKYKKIFLGHFIFLFLKKTLMSFAVLEIHQENTTIQALAYWGKFFFWILASTSIWEVWKVLLSILILIHGHIIMWA